MSQLQSLIMSQLVGHSWSRSCISVAFVLLGQLHCTIQPSSSKNASFSVYIKFHQYNQACDIYSWEILPIYWLINRIGHSSLPYLIAKPSDQLLKLSTSLIRPYVLQRLCRIKSESFINEATAFTLFRSVYLYLVALHRCHASLSRAWHFILCIYIIPVIISFYFWCFFCLWPLVYCFISPFGFRSHFWSLWHFWL